MPSPPPELAKFKKLVDASKHYPGAVAFAHAVLKKLRETYGRSPHRFSEKHVQQIKDLKERLPKKWIELMQCPRCHGGGTQRWMAAYKHACNLCGGFRRVEKTEEAVREYEYTWGTAPAISK